MAESRSNEQRRRAAAETFGAFFPGADADALAEGLVRRQGALGSMAFEAVGEMWSRPQLKRRDRSLLVISALAAQARDEELTLHTRIGLRNGLAREEIEEILLHVAAYAGFPAAMAASRKVDAGLLAESGADKLPERSPAARKSDAERDAAAARVLGRMIGAPDLAPEAGLGMLERTAGDVGVTAYRWAFGEIWSREALSPRDRSIVVIAILTTMGATRELGFHAPAGERNGLDRPEIAEVVHHLALYAGIPRAVEAIEAIRAAFARTDGAP